MGRMMLICAVGVSVALPAAAQMPNPQQLLQGLFTGNQQQDQALRDAFERGYQRGRQDEARLGRERGNDRPRRQDYEDRDRRNPDPSLGRQPYGR